MLGKKKYWIKDIWINIVRISRIEFYDNVNDWKIKELV